MSETDEIKKAMKSKKKKNTISKKDFLSTGSTLLNLACTNNPRGGFIKGTYVFFVGDSSSGKTWLSLGCLAEASINKHFKDYRLIYDNGENGALMDLSYYFGDAVAERLEPPRYSDDGDEMFSSKIEEFYYNVDDAVKEGKPFIYILDSMDSLSSKDEADKFNESKNAYEKGTTNAGSYGDGKAKKNSAGLRVVVDKLGKTKSILIIICQSRDNLGFGFEKKTRSGGRALKFYATLEMWTAVKKKIKKKVKGKDREIGANVEIKIKKNRITGRQTTIEIPLYHSIGVDDVGCCIDYLVSEKHWKMSGNSVSAPEFEFKGLKAKLIKHIEDNDLEKELQDIVGLVWHEILDACSIDRKRKYE